MLVLPPDCWDSAVLVWRLAGVYVSACARVDWIGFRLPFSGLVRDSGRCGLMAGRCLIVVLLAGRWNSVALWCDEWLVVVCRPAPVWTRSVLDSRSLVWSVVWVVWTDGRAVVDCCAVGRPLGFR